MELRSIWNGSLTVRRVSVPVGIAPAQHREGVSFRTIHSCGAPVRQERVCPEHGPVASEELVKGYEFSPGQFLVVDEDELKALRADKTIAVERFVEGGELGSIDTGALDRVYFLLPADDPVGRRPYALLARALEKSGRVGLARVTLAQNDRVCLLSSGWDGNVLVLTTLYLPGEVRSPNEITKLIGPVQLEPAELALAHELLEAMTKERLDLRRAARGDRLRALVDSKLAGDAPPVLAAPPPPSAAPRDLAEALRASLPKGGQRSRKKPARAKAVATQPDQH